MQNKLFEMALGITEPYFVKDIEFDADKKKLDIHIDFRKGAMFTITGKNGEAVQAKAYDTVDKTWRHLNFFEHECYLHARVPRIKYDDGIKQVKMPWEGMSNGFTLLFEALLLQLCMGMPVYKASKITGASDDKIWKMLERYVLAYLKQSDYSDVTAVGIDETSQKKHHDYITLFVDLIRRRTLFIADGKGSGTVEEFISMLEQQNGKAENISQVSCDMSPAFIKGVRENLPEAEVTFDRFHVMKIINDAVDRVRRLEVRTDPNLKGMKYVFLKNNENLTPGDLDKLDKIRFAECGKKTLKAFQLKELFRELYTAGTDEVFERGLKKWYYLATHSRIGAIVEAAKTIRRHWDGVMNWIKSRINNGILEGIASLIQAGKRVQGVIRHRRTLKLSRIC
ncbi:MAG: ISL3 family transposase [Brevinematales bacterium]|nr:ISL3 family transposase [Brevinematales bacterium]